MPGLGSNSALTADERGELIGEAAAGLAGIIGQPEFIAADPADIPAVLRPVQQGQRWWCERLANTGVDESIVGDYANDLCSPYLAPDQLPQFNPGSVPFTGGQCPGETYNVAWRFEGTITNVQNGDVNPRVLQGNETVTGPVTRDVNRTSSPGSTSPNETVEIIINGVGVASAAFTKGSGSFTTFNPETADGGPDVCGDPPGTPPSYGPAPNPPQDPGGMPIYDPGGGRPGVQIDIGLPSVNIDGTINAPITIDGNEFNLGGPYNGTPSSQPGPDSPDYAQPGNPQSPGPGGADGGDNPPDGLDFSGPVAAVLVNITQSPPNTNREIGGPEAIVYGQPCGDYGWFRWKAGAGVTGEERITAQSQMFIFSPGCCVETNGFEVKFSFGVSGTATPFPCENA